jgi:beta-glucosidase
MEVFGLFDKSRPPGPSPVDVAAGARTAREVAVAGAVLLSDDGALPLTPEDLHSLTVIGPTAAQLAAGTGGERAYGVPDRLISPLEALREAAGTGNDIKYALGVDLTGHAVPSTVLRTEQGEPGLTRTTPDGSTTVDAAVDFTGPNALPGGRDYTWTGTITVPADGDYDLKIQSWGGTGTLEVDGVMVASSAVPRDGFTRPWTSLLPTTDGLDNAQVTTHFGAKQSRWTCPDLGEAKPGVSLPHLRERSEWVALSRPGPEHVGPRFGPPWPLLARRRVTYDTSRSTSLRDMPRRLRPGRSVLLSAQCP